MDAMHQQGINVQQSKYFLPPYEWYNQSIADWTNDLGLQLINYTPGTKSAADYTWPGLNNYQSSNAIYQSIISYEKNHEAGLNGFILLLHVGTDARRTDKFYNLLPKLLTELKSKGYNFKKADELLKQ